MNMEELVEVQYAAFQLKERAMELRKLLSTHG